MFKDDVVGVDKVGALVGLVRLVLQAMAWTEDDRRATNPNVTVGSTLKSKQINIKMVVVAQAFMSLLTDNERLVKTDTNCMENKIQKASDEAKDIGCVGEWRREVTPSPRAQRETVGNESKGYSH